MIDEKRRRESSKNFSFFRFPRVPRFASNMNNANSNGVTSPKSPKRSRVDSGVEKMGNEPSEVPSYKFFSATFRHRTDITSRLWRRKFEGGKVGSM
jgi:hypothetical protein